MRKKIGGKRLQAKSTYGIHFNYLLDRPGIIQHQVRNFTRTTEIVVLPILP